MDINIKGNPGTRNHFTEVKIAHVENVNPAAKEVKVAYVINKNKGGDTLVWHPVHEPYPHPKNGGDVQLLLKVQNLPMPYLTATWDGNNLHTFSTFGYPDSPWTSFPESIKIEAWAVLP